jgi:PIN domain nuclease of toxin-antitoxin system
VIVLDTHAWLWWLSNPGLLSPTARRATERAAASKSVWVSTISTWEIAMLAARGRLELSMPVSRWVRLSEALPFLRFLPPDNAVLLQAAALDESFPKDPADRIIAATALHLECPLVTKDQRLRSQPAPATIW